MSEATRQPKRTPADKARLAVERNPALVAQLHEGDPAAIFSLLQAAGGKIKGATMRVAHRKSLEEPTLEEKTASTG